MCIFSPPKMPAVPTPATFQPTQAPKDMTQNNKASKDAFKRRGFWASIYAGNAAAPTTTSTTGGSAGTTGG